MESPPIRVLLVEDDEDDYILVRKLFSAISAASTTCNGPLHTKRPWKQSAGTA